MGSLSSSCFEAACLIAAHMALQLSKGNLRAIKKSLKTA